MEPTAIVIATTGLFGAGLLKGLTGLGYTTCALPFLVAGLGLRPAMALVIAPAIAANVFLLFDVGHLRETLARFKVFYLALLPGISLGVLLLGSFDVGLAIKVLGVLTVVYAAFAYFQPRLSLPGHWEGLTQLPAGLVNGMLTGLTGSQILPLVPYMVSLRLEPDRFVQAVNVAVTLSSVAMALGLGFAGIMTPTLAALSVVGILPALLGTRIGTRMRATIPTGHFRSVVLVALGAIGIAMAVR